MYRQKLFRNVAAYAALLIAGAHAARPIDLDDTGDPPQLERVQQCIENARVTLSATPSAIIMGSSSLLAWSVSFPGGCSMLHDLLLSGRRVAHSGTLNVQPMSNATFTLSIGTPGGRTQLATTGVSVTLPNTVYINGSTPDWRALLIQAVGEDKKKVILAPNVDMDMTGFWDIPIASGVTLTSELDRVLERVAFAAPMIKHDFSRRSVPSRDAHRLGPRLFTRCNSARKALFVTQGGDTKIRNFRLEGPQYGVAYGDDKLEFGIAAHYAPGVRIEISNMEFSGWGGVAVQVQGDPNDHATRPFENVWIHDNFFHHNQHEGGNGYGVAVKHNAHALIERNVFDFNRHAIAAGGEDGTGYIARHNLVLKGGGFHADISGYTIHTHQFDVHGTERCDFEDIFKPLSCGQAGEQFEMVNNAFQYTKGYAIKVRGNPTEGASVVRNVFAHSGSGDAIRQNGNNGAGDNITNPIEQKGNDFGYDSYGKYGVCDFDADGKDDLFLATGQSWWYMSGANRHWVFLNTSSERIEGLGLGDFDGDKRCDVFSVHASDFGIFKSGTGDWTSLGYYPGVPIEQLRFADFNADGITDIFRRDANGQWWKVSPGYYPWTPLASSRFDLSELRFGDFNSDRVADVIAVEDGRWAVSWSGATTWEELNPGISASLSNVQIGDLDGNGVDDIARFSRSGLTSGKWEVSPDGRGPWRTLGNVSSLLLLSMHGLIGRFTGAAHDDLLSIDHSRLSRKLDRASASFEPYGLYAY